MVAIRDRIATPPTAGPSGRNHPPPLTSNPDPTQDPPGHLGPAVPSGKLHPKPRLRQLDNSSGNPVPSGHLGSSAPSGRNPHHKDPEDPRVTLDRHLNLQAHLDNVKKSRQGTEMDGLTSAPTGRRKQQEPQTTGGHLGPLGLPETRAVRPTQSDRPPTPPTTTTSPVRRA
nr:extensin-like [Aedes albopictus]